MTAAIADSLLAALRARLGHDWVWTGADAGLRPLELALMRRIKQALDPLNLMNPGKVLT